MYFFKDTNGNWIIGESVDSIVSKVPCELRKSSPTTVAVRTVESRILLLSPIEVTALRKNAAGEFYATFTEFKAAVSDFFDNAPITAEEVDAKIGAEVDILSDRIDTVEGIANAASSGSLGSIKPTDAAPTPARNGNYTFSIGGAKPAWLTAEAGITEVKAGDGVAVVYTAPSSYTYTHVDVSSDFVTIQELKDLTGNLFSISGFIQVNGVHLDDATRLHTDYLRIAANTDLVLYGESNNEYVNVISFYDSDKVYISGISNNQVTISEQTISSSNIPANAVYIRASTTLDLLSKSFIHSGNIQSLLQAVETRLIGLNSITVGKLNNKLDKKIGKNLFNKDAAGLIDGKYLTGVGILLVNTSYFVSDYIPVLPNATYVHSNFEMGGASSCIYDAGKNFISTFQTETVTVPSNGYFIRMSGVVSNKAIQQFELGTVATTYEPYTIYGFMGNVADQIPNRETVCILPKKMYFVKGKESCMYYENILFKNLHDPTTLYFDNGINYNRQATFNFSLAATNQTLNAQVIRSFKKGQLKTITYDVIDPVTNNGKTVNALHIGDSFTDIGSWVKEVKTLLSAQGVTYNLIGTCGDSTFRAEGLSGGTLANTFLNNSSGIGRRVQITGVTTLPSTGYPGRTYRDSNGVDWTIRSGKIDGSGNGHMVVTRFGAVESDFTNFPASGVLTKQGTGEGDATINYSNPIACYFNPFINPSTGLLDLTNYISTWGFASPGLVIFQFTWNDTGIWGSDTNISNLVTSFKQAADHVHATYPNAKVIFSIEPFGSINGNKDWNGKKYTVLRLMELLLIQFEDDANYNTWVKIAPAYAFVDLVYGYASNNVTPCSRYTSVTENSGGDGVHPNTGMLQIADCVSQVVSAII